MQLIKVLTDAHPSESEMWELVEKFYGLLLEKYSVIEEIGYHTAPRKHMTVFMIHIGKCKRSVLTEIKKTLESGKRYFVVDYKIV